jgi:hypothetical protein
VRSLLPIQKLADSLSCGQCMGWLTLVNFSSLNPHRLANKAFPQPRVSHVVPNKAPVQPSLPKNFAASGIRKREILPPTWFGRGGLTFDSSIFTQQPFWVNKSLQMDSGTNNCKQTRPHR